MENVISIDIPDSEITKVLTFVIIVDRNQWTSLNSIVKNATKQVIEKAWVEWYWKFHLFAIHRFFIELVCSCEREKVLYFYFISVNMMLKIFFENHFPFAKANVYVIGDSLINERNNYTEFAIHLLRKCFHFEYSGTWDENEFLWIIKFRASCSSQEIADQLFSLDTSTTFQERLQIDGVTHNNFCWVHFIKICYDAIPFNTPSFSANQKVSAYIF